MAPASLLVRCGLLLRKRQHVLQEILGLPGRGAQDGEGSVCCVFCQISEGCPSGAVNSGGKYKVPGWILAGCQPGVCVKARWGV